VAIPVSRVILYVKEVARVAAFYQQHFGMKPLPGNEKGWLEMSSGKRGCNIALHKAASSQKSCAAMKIVFGVSNVRKFKAEREADGLRFGPIHSPGELEFANAKDPAVTRSRSLAEEFRIHEADHSPHQLGGKPVGCRAQPSRAALISRRI